MSNQNIILDECGCCEGIKSLTPAELENNPGLSALAYRVGTHGSFKKTMHSALSTIPALGKLTTRDDDDPAVSLLDAWAAVLDVLTFYQERIANEAYLRTATERRSVLELARHISYKPRPGVAAGTYLAFTMEDAPGAPSEATIAVGTRAQSVPGQDELPQVFETVEEIEAKTAWNALKPRKTKLILPVHGDTTLYLKGISTNLKRGDALLIIGEERKGSEGDERWDFRKVEAVDEVPPSVPSADPDAGYTKVTLDRGLGSVTPYGEPAGKDPEVYALRQQAALFGHNAPDCRTMPDNIREEFYLADKQVEWSDFTIRKISPTANTVCLDAVYPKILPGSWVVLSYKDNREVYEVISTADMSQKKFTLTSKVTRLELEGEYLDLLYNHRVRATMVYAQSEKLEMAETPITDPVKGKEIVLDSVIGDLEKEQKLIITGKPIITHTSALENDETVSELMELSSLEAEDDKHTKLVLTESLENIYDRTTVTISANVARATHGETKTEVLGSGDGSKMFQEFQLKQKPLTYVSAATADGTETTLEIRVNDILWKEVATFYGVSSEERFYITRIADDGTVTVQFGDGITGARLPTGSENVKATYRVGTGLDGHVKAEQISLLMTPQLGVKGVINPSAPSGADDPETLENARRNAPVTVLTLDRIVSLWDYEDFTSAYSGIGKARVAVLWKGEQRIVHITVAAADEGGVDEASDLYKNLVAAIDAARHPDHQVRIDSFRPLTFTVKARILVDDDYIAENVLAAVSDALEEAFAFKVRDFGQDVTPSEVTAVIQGVKGVVAVDLEKLDGRDPFKEEHFRLTAETADWDQSNEGNILAAQLLTINPNGIDLTEMTK